MKILFDLFFTFLKIGGFTFGGGYAMIPIIQHEMVEKKEWVSSEEMTDYITLGQSVPGVLGINVATAVGNKVAGIPGSIIATLGMIVPSFVVILLIATVLDRLQQLVLVQKAFGGIRAAVAALIFVAVIKMYPSVIKNNLHICIAIITAICILFFKVQPPIMLLLAALTALLIKVRS